MNNFDTLLANINRNYIHPPSEIDEVLNFLILRSLCAAITEAMPIRYLDILLQRNARE